MINDLYLRKIKQNIISEKRPNSKIENKRNALIYLD